MIVHRPTNKQKLKRLKQRDSVKASKMSIGNLTNVVNQISNNLSEYSPENRRRIAHYPIKP